MEIGKDGLANSGTIRGGVHVNDVGADSDVDRRGNTSLISCRKNARIGEFESTRSKRSSNPGAEPEAITGGILGHLIEKRAGLLGHPEAAVEKLGGDVFGSAANHREFEIMNDRGAVGG
ncbi:MAG TPA: hypothetical protein VHX12_02445, partial [Acidisoma sp.]|nr:hypothetical protein [Acidisoma sp.]